ncbi:hypothetical protein PMV_039 [Port-miou virus]|uniref:Uncharacterized protein n=1 Tax=Port-miou virus TaxID=1733873 RepID=A0A0N9PW02_9VIRU|nr:hypothetical protein PMV_039 [Port-miou virus]
METLITACFGTSASLAITGFALCTWRTKRHNKRILGASNARLFEVDPNGARTVYALKGSEVSRVKSLGFQGKIHKKNILSIETLLKRPIYSSQRGTIQVKESTEPISLSAERKRLQRTTQKLWKGTSQTMKGITKNKAPTHLITLWPFVIWDRDLLCTPVWVSLSWMFLFNKNY